MSANSDNKSTSSLQSSGDQDVHPDRLICLSIVVLGAGTFGLVLVGNWLSFSPQSGTGPGLSWFSLLGGGGSQNQVPLWCNQCIHVRNLVCCLYLAHHTLGRTDYLFWGQVLQANFTLLKPGLRSQYMLVVTTLLEKPLTLGSAITCTCLTWSVT